MVVVLDIIGVGTVELRILPGGVAHVRHNDCMIGTARWEKTGDRLVMRDVPMLPGLEPEPEPEPPASNRLDASSDTNDVLVFRLDDDR